jgi:hypothetical protein
MHRQPLRRSESLSKANKKSQKRRATAIACVTAAAAIAIVATSLLVVYVWNASRRARKDAMSREISGKCTEASAPMFIQVNPLCQGEGRFDGNPSFVSMDSYMSSETKTQTNSQSYVDYSFMQQLTAQRGQS